MGGSKKVTVSYWYPLDAHLGLSKGPLDALREIRGGDRVAWRGRKTTSGVFRISRPNLYGGESSEGGIDGNFELMMGEPDQMPNSYLASVFGAAQPGYRGRASIVLRGPKIGAGNPYPKPLYFKLERFFKGWDDEPWYPEKLKITMRPSNKLSIYFAIDLSGSMDEITSNGQTRLANMKTALNAVLDLVLAEVIETGGGADIMFVGFGTQPDTRQSILRRNCTAADIASLKSWVSSRATNLWTFFPAGVIDAIPFFNDSDPKSEKMAFFITDGFPSTSDGSMPPQIIAEITAQIINDIGTEDDPGNVPFYGINIDLDDTTYTAIVDNTPEDEVPVVEGGDPEALTSVIMAAIGGLSAMNPAHIIYDSIVSIRENGGMEEPPARINEASFRAAADKWYSERFGLCCTWNGGETAEQFQQRILNVAGACLSQSRIDGTYHLDLLRGDYVIENLPVVTDDDLEDWLAEPAVPAEQVNQLQVKWFDPTTREERITPPVQALGAIEDAGGVFADIREYFEIPSEDIALRVAQRDLNSVSTPLWKFTFSMRKKPFDARPGTYVRIMCPKRGFADVVVVLGEVDYGTLGADSIRIVALQDVFGMPESAYVDPQPSLAPKPNARPANISVFVSMEMPYVEVVAQLPPAELAAVDPDVGMILAGATKPANGINYGFATRAAGEEYEIYDNGDYCARVTITEEDVLLNGEPATDFTFTDGRETDRVEIGTWAAWGDEIVRVDEFDAATGTVKFARGCIDTRPHPHAAGSYVYFIGDWYVSDAREYALGESVFVKIMNRTAQAQIGISSAPEQLIPIRARQGRPYLPGQFKINGEYYPEEATGPAPLLVTWVGRNREVQADQIIPMVQGDITPPAGVTWTLRGYENNVLAHVQDGIAGYSTTWTPSETGMVRVEVYSVDSDGRESFQPQSHEMQWYATIPVDQMAKNILAKLRHWWPMGAYNDTGFMFTDVHGGADIRIYSGTEAGVVNGAPSVRTGGGSATTFQGTAGAGVFLHGKPSWLIERDDLTALAWTRLQAVVTPNSRDFFIDAPATDSSESINSSLQLVIQDAASPYGLRAYWEYGVGSDVSFPAAGPALGLLTPTQPYMIGLNRLDAAMSANFVVNGASVAQEIYSHNPTGGDNVACKLSFGSRPTTNAASITSQGNFALRGDMQDIMMFCPALNSDEAAWLYNGGAGKSYQELWDDAELTRPWTPALLSRKVLWVKGDSDENRESAPGVVDRVANHAGFMPGTPYSGGASNQFRNNLSLLNGYKVLTADGSANGNGHFVFPNTNFSRFTGVDGISAIMVHKPRVAPTSACTYLSATVAGSNTATMYLGTAPSVNTGYANGGRRVSGETFAFGASDPTPRLEWALIGCQNDYNTGLSRLRINGTETTAATYTTGVTATGNPNQPLAVGGSAYNTTDRSLNSEYAEILIFDKRLTATEFQQLEGYLAHKYGLASLLPAGHPYKSAPPTI